MSIFRTRYRIVTDHYNGFEAQYRRWWMPFYCQCFSVNTETTVQKARELIQRHAKRQTTSRVVEVCSTTGDTP